MYWLADSEPVRVQAACLPIGEAADEGTNNLCGIIEHADGSIGNFIYTTQGAASSQGERVELYGAGFSVIAEDFKNLRISGTSQSSKSRRFAEKGYQAQMDSFVDSIINGEPSDVSVVDGARATLVCRALIESARSGQPVDIDLGILFD
jgi:predicted dehydrogenase